MIRYELKDKERQAALEKALPVFKKMLQHACENHRPEYFDEHKSVAVFYSTADGAWGSGEWMIELPTDDIEVIKEYDPNKWNNYPEVTPPEGVPMRLEVVEASWDRSLEGERLCAIWKVGTFTIINDDQKTESETTEGRWYREYKGKPDEMLDIYGFILEEKVFKARFRPWNDEETAK